MGALPFVEDPELSVRATSATLVLLYHLYLIAPMSSATALVLVEMAMEDTTEKEQMGTRNNWRKIISEPDDETGASRANAQVLYIGLR